MTEKNLTLGHSVALTPPFVQNSWDTQEVFKKAMLDKGIHFKGEVIADGVIHRFSVGQKGHKDGWYVFYGLAGAFGDWSRDIHEKWNVSNTIVPGLDKETFYEQVNKAKEAAEEEKHQKYEETAKFALEKWQSLSEAGESPYLTRKQIKPIGIRFNKGFLVIPLRDTSGKLWSLQWIAPNGTKRFLPGGRKKGCFHYMGVLEDRKPIIICEGYATGASIHIATQHTTVVAFDAGNIEPVIEELKKAYPKSFILIAGDDDQWKQINMGKQKAEQAARKNGYSIIFPQFKNLETKPTDFNDLHVLEGLPVVKDQLEKTLQRKTLNALNIKDLLSLDVPPRDMILGPIIPEQGLVMIHAPRGIGKTHVSLQIAYTVSSGDHMFQGRWNSLKANKVLFVDGEMPLSVMQERLAKIVKSADSEITAISNLLIITPDIQRQSLLDLSTPQGQNAIEEHLQDVKLLILDNYSSLCRSGRENEAESWIPLQEWFLDLRRRGISVLMIHHSNKAGTQRGTSRKEDLLDTVITLKKPENYDSREGARFEVHYEKARGFYGEEAAPFEAWLKEEQGKMTWHIRNIEDCEMDKVLLLKKEGLSQRHIADETGLSPATINRRLKEAKEKGLFNESY